MSQTKPVFVVGATGFLGSEICRQLTTANKSVKALIRSTSDPTKIAALQSMGIETVVGDIKDKASLEQAFAGAGAVISTTSSTFSRQEGDTIDTVDRRGQLNVVEAAEASGVTQFIFISFLQSPESFPLQNAKHAVEERLGQSKMSYTILRPTFFMEIWLSPHLGFDPAVGTVTIYGAGENKISWISLRDVAAFAVASVDEEAAHNRTIDLGGPDALSPLEVVQLFEQQTGKPIQVQHVPEEALRSQKEGATDSLQQSFTALMLTYVQGAEVPMEETLKQIPIKLTSVKDYCRHVLEAVTVG